MEMRMLRKGEEEKEEYISSLVEDIGLFSRQQGDTGQWKVCICTVYRRSDEHFKCNNSGFRRN